MQSLVSGFRGRALQCDPHRGNWCRDEAGLVRRSERRKLDFVLIWRGSVEGLSNYSIHCCNTMNE